MDLLSVFVPVNWALVHQRLLCRTSVMFSVIVMCGLVKENEGIANQILSSYSIDYEIHEYGSLIAPFGVERISFGA